MSTITAKTRQMSFDDIQDKTKIRYIQILNRLDKPKTAKELAVELFDLGFIPKHGKELHRATLVRISRHGNG